MYMSDFLPTYVLIIDRWKKTYPKDYQTAYVSAGLPQIFEPFVRVEMAGWNPLGRGQEEEAAAIESFHWYTCLFSYGQGECSYILRSR